MFNNFIDPSSDKARYFPPPKDFKPQGLAPISTDFGASKFSESGIRNKTSQGARPPRPSNMLNPNIKSKDLNSTRNLKSPAYTFNGPSMLPTLGLTQYKDKDL